MPNPVIEIRDLSQFYGAQLILNQISLTVYAGEFLTLLGPSGCGKTTLLRLISGFEYPSSGSIYLNGLSVNDVPPQRRDVHTVFQSYALFGHLSVYENVAFALRCKKTPEDEIEHRVKEALRMVHLESYGSRSTRKLSGGQQQRVAIARAIINRPQVLLLDEPLSSLDYRLRKAMQYELKQLQQDLKLTFVFVTHDQEEALSMSDRIVILHHGEIQQIGTPHEVYERPCNLTVAKFIGETNIFETTIIRRESGYLFAEIESCIMKSKDSEQFNPGDQVNWIIRPEDLRIWTEDTETDLNHRLPCTIISMVYKGPTVDFILRLKSGKTIHLAKFFDEDDSELSYHIHQEVWIDWIPGWEVLLAHEH